mmetsp:Transcript_33464/g.105731  ORF Transcript_33464/g.105731 Transcript_33464/m.105731 type:complete len:500 (-) Transcript_33464:234-1733(-)
MGNAFSCQCSGSIKEREDVAREIDELDGDDLVVLVLDAEGHELDRLPTKMIAWVGLLRRQIAASEGIPPAKVGLLTASGQELIDDQQLLEDAGLNPENCVITLKQNAEHDSVLASVSEVGSVTGHDSEVDAALDEIEADLGMNAVYPSTPRRGNVEVSDLSEIFESDIEALEAKTMRETAMSTDEINIDIGDAPESEYKDPVVFDSEKPLDSEENGAQHESYSIWDGDMDEDDTDDDEEDDYWEPEMPSPPTRTRHSVVMRELLMDDEESMGTLTPKERLSSVGWDANASKGTGAIATISTDSSAVSGQDGVGKGQLRPWDDKSKPPSESTEPQLTIATPPADAGAALPGDSPNHSNPFDDPSPKKAADDDEAQGEASEDVLDDVDLAPAVVESTEGVSEKAFRIVGDDQLTRDAEELDCDIEVEFVNDTTSVVNLQWVGFRGTRRDYSTLEPSEECKVGTRKNHVWRLNDLDTGENIACVEVLETCVLPLSVVLKARD